MKSRFMIRQLLLLFLCSSIIASAALPASAKEAKRGLGKKLGKTLETTQEESGDHVVYFFRNHPVELQNADGKVLFYSNYYELGLDPETAGSYPGLAKWVHSYNEDAAASSMSFLEHSVSDVYEMFDSGWEYAFESEKTLIPVRADSHVFSFIEGTSTYLGGAHGVINYSSVNIHPETGEEIPFDEVFDCTDNLPSDLPDILFRAILEQNEDLVDYFDDLMSDKQAYQDSFERANFFSLVYKALQTDPVSLTWALDYDGVRFYFNDYSLGSYAAGARNCTLKFAEYPELFTSKYSADTASLDSALPNVKEETQAEPEILHTYNYDAVYAYASFLEYYADQPSVQENEFGNDIPESEMDIRVNVIYLDEDEIPELVIANGENPENPVHLFSYSPERMEVNEDGAFSMYGKMYYEEGTGFFLPIYYMPYGNGEVLQYDKGTYRLKESWSMDFSDGEAYFVNGKKATRDDIERIYDAWLEHSFRPVFSEFRPILLGEALGTGAPESEEISQDESSLKQILKRAAGLGTNQYLTGAGDLQTGQDQNTKTPSGPKTVKVPDGVWFSDDGEFAYLEIDGSNFAVYSEDGYAEYMGVIMNEFDGSLHNEYSFECYTPDGGFFDFGEWLRADDPAMDVISLGDETYRRYMNDYTGKPVRSPWTYMTADIMFLGEHPGQDKKSSLVIEQAPIHAGGYQVTIDFGDGNTGFGYASPDISETLSMYYGTLNASDSFSAVISQNQDTLEYTLRITSSECEDIPADSVYTFTY